MLHTLRLSKKFTWTAWMTLWHPAKNIFHLESKWIAWTTPWPHIPTASMHLTDPVPCLATPGVFCRRVLPSLPQPDIVSLDGMSLCALVANMDTERSNATPGGRGTDHPASRHVAFSPMSEDESLLSMSTIPPRFSPLPPAYEAELIVACMHSGGVTAYHRAPRVGENWLAPTGGHGCPFPKPPPPSGPP